MTKLNTASNFCFFFPYHEDSGVPVLFYRIANIIASLSHENKVSIIDYENGAMARHMHNLPNLKHIVFHDNVDVIPPEDAILIMQSDVPYYWPSKLKPTVNTRIFFWNLHPRNFVPSLLPFPVIREWPFKSFKLYKLLTKLFPTTIKNLQDFVNLLIVNNAISFMDQTNNDYTQKYLFLKDKIISYLPVPIPIPISSIEINNSGKKRNNNGINVCWIGRICDFKVHIMVYICNKLKVVAEQLEINLNFHIVGDGPFMKHAQENIVTSDFFKVSYIGALPHGKLANYISENVDIVAAMGTSALEGAALGKPTILLDFSYSKIEVNYQFRWIFETINYDLGHEISKKDIDNKGESLLQMINEVITNYDDISKKCYDYCYINHNIDNIVNKLIDLANQSTLTYGMINKKYFQKPLMLRFYNKLRGLKSN
jgi:hypothetical protein